MLEKKIYFHEATRQIIKADKNINWDLVNLTTPVGFKIVDNEYVATIQLSEATITFAGILASNVLVNDCIEIAALKEGFVYGLEIENVIAGDKIKAGNGIFEKTTLDDFVAEVIDIKENNYCLVVAKQSKTGSGGEISKQAALWADYTVFYTKSIVKGVNNFFIISGYVYGNAVMFDAKGGDLYTIDEIIDYSKVYALATTFTRYLSSYPNQLALIAPIYPNIDDDNGEITKKIGVTKKLYVALKLPYTNSLELGIYSQQANTEKLQAVKDWITANSPGGVFLKLNADWASYPLFKKEEIIFDTYEIFETIIVYDEEN